MKCTIKHCKNQASDFGVYSPFGGFGFYAAYCETHYRTKKIISHEVITEDEFVTESVMEE